MEETLKQLVENNTELTKAVSRIDVGLNGTNGAEGLIKRFDTHKDKVENIFEEYRISWAFWKEVKGHVGWIARMSAYGFIVISVIAIGYVYFSNLAGG